MPKIYYCLKCSTAIQPYPHACRKFMRAWKTDYKALRRVYIRHYNPDKLCAIGWFCFRCGNFIRTTELD